MDLYIKDIENDKDNKNFIDQYSTSYKLGFALKNIKKNGKVVNSYKSFPILINALKALNLNIHTK